MKHWYKRPWLNTPPTFSLEAISASTGYLESVPTKEDIDERIMFYENLLRFYTESAISILEYHTSLKILRDQKENYIQYLLQEDN